MDPFRPFLRTRARLHRLRDAKISNCRVREISAARAMVEVTLPAGSAIGETFLIEAVGPGYKLLVQVVLAQTVDKWSVFEMSGAPKFTPTGEAVRYAVTPIDTVLESVDGMMMGQIIDISQRGLGILAPEGLDKGTEVAIQVPEKRDSLRLGGVVCYARKMPPGGFKIGVQLQNLDRVTLARWLRLFASLSPAA